MTHLKPLAFPSYGATQSPAYLLHISNPRRRAPTLPESVLSIRHVPRILCDNCTCLLGRQSQRQASSSHRSCSETCISALKLLHLQPQRIIPCRGFLVQTLTKLRPSSCLSILIRMLAVLLLERVTAIPLQIASPLAGSTPRVRISASCFSYDTKITNVSFTNFAPHFLTPPLDVGPVSIVEMLFCTSLVAIVGTADSGPSASPRHLHIVNTKVCRSGMS